MPKVSVILPVYNVEAYLDEALYSLEEQTLKDIEIIAVNDGSTDNSLSILDKHALTDKRISIYSQKNKGLSGARNTGLNLCQGEYVYFMDSDDIIDKTALEECYNYAKKHDADVCLFDAEVFYEKDAFFASFYFRSELINFGSTSSLIYLETGLAPKAGSYILSIMLSTSFFVNFGSSTFLFCFHASRNTLI